MVTNVTSLLKTVKSVEDEATRGTRALESTIEAIGQEIKVGATDVVGINVSTERLKCRPMPRQMAYRQPAQNGVLTDQLCLAIYCIHLSIMPMQIAIDIT